MKGGFVLLAVLTGTLTMTAQDLPETLPEVRWHLTAREWKPLGIPRSAYLEPLEQAARAMAKLQNAEGAIIDPWEKREWQYATPYFAHAMGVLLKQGRAEDLREVALKAMEHSTRSFAGGSARIPDQHGEFYIPALAEGLELYHGIAPDAQWERWQPRLKTPLAQVIEGFDSHVNNWRTYAMRGEWLRAKAGLADRAEAIRFIERSWQEQQRDRVAPSKWHLYLDRSSEPQSQAVEAVGRGHLPVLAMAGYNGPSGAEIRELVEAATHMTLLLQDPTGQAPANGRTDDHVWNDILYQLCFEMMAERAQAAGDKRLAGQYRRAAMLAFQSALRWQHRQGEHAGAFQITKNFFDPGLRVGYQPASQWTNYNGAVLIHLAEAFETRQTEIEEAPTPAEIGGYVFATGPEFSTVFANAGGMQVMVNLRGEVDPAKYGVYWTPLGMARFSRAGWDSRLGPSDGVRDSKTKRGVTFGPTWEENGKWVRLADVPHLYEGTWMAEFAHPLLVRFRVDWTPKEGDGPWFVTRYTVTPDGVLVETDAPLGDAAVTWPVLTDDGRALEHGLQSRMAWTSYPGGGDRQNFLSLDESARINAEDQPVQSPVGWLRPVRVRSGMRMQRTFVYPQSEGDPPAEEVLRRFWLNGSGGYDGALGRVSGNLYVGRHAAGGVGKSLDFEQDGQLDLTFSEECAFVIRMESGRATAIETDRPVTARIYGQTIQLQAFTPVKL